MSDKDKNPEIYFGSYNSYGNNSSHVAVNKGNINQNNSGTINTVSFSVDSKYKDELPGVYSRALEDFEKQINKYLDEKKTNLSLKPVEVNKEIRELETLTNDIAKGVNGNISKELDEKKKFSLFQKMKDIGKKLIKILPEGISIGLAMTPLAPFANLAGKAIEEIVN